MSGVAGTVTALVKAGADVNALEPGWNQSPLMLAAARGRTDAVRVLMKAGANPSLAARTMDIMASAAQDRQAKMRRDAVLQKLREAQGQANNPNWIPTPEQVQAAVKASREVEQAAASAQAIAGVRDATAAEEARLAAQGGRGLDDDNPAYNEMMGVQGGLTALLLAVREGEIETTMALLDGGANIDQVSAGDRTSPLLMAAINGHYDLTLALVKRGANPNLYSDAGAGPLFAVLNKEWAPSTRTPQPAFQLQQQATYLEVVKALLDAKADPNARLSRSLWYTTYNRDNLGV
ncbi:MAG: ankyrin repeat domain-containing protein, partial [Gemmatimonadaceae bacterium]|nr:ankyrin repeat domain-containing protein [Gemmatimonadaceae bacterium]